MNAQKLRLIRIAVTLPVLGVLLVLEYAPVPDWCRWLQLGLAIAAFLVVGYDVLLKTLRRLAHGQVFDEDFLMTIACLGAFAIGEYPEAVAVMLFAQVGAYLEKRAVDASRRSIRSLLSINPDVAAVYGDSQPTPCGEVAVGTLIVVKAGERVPIDGEIVEGESDLDMSSLNGESMPLAVRVGDAVLSGSINLTGLLVVRTTKEYGQSTASRMIALIEQARDQKAPVENFVTKFAKYFTPIVVSVAVLLAIIPPLCMDMHDWPTWATWLKKALVFLVVSCPCAIVISVPLSYFGAIGAASRLGILIKGGHVFDKLAKVDTIAFDKTGTVTKGHFEVAEVDGEDQEAVLCLCAAAEQYSNHPIATSVVAAYHARCADALPVCSDVVELHGKGVLATCEGRRLVVGTGELLREQGLDVADLSGVGTRIYLGVEGRYMGCIVVKDVIKEDSAAAIAAMKAYARTVMLSGDREQVVAEMAHEAGIDEYHAAMMPEDKLRYVQQHTGDGAVAFVGDGINDAPVLVAADVGLAMGGIGQDAAIESSDIVLMKDSLWGVDQVYRIARKTQRIVKQNIVFALGVKLAVMALSLTPFSRYAAMMWMAVGADVGVSALAILNALRTMRTNK